MIFRRKFTELAICVLASAALLPISPAIADSSSAAHVITLNDGWALQSSRKVHATGAQISKAGFRTVGWHTTKVPSTVLAALVADKTYPDPYFGMNLRSIPGTTYPIGKNFSEMPMLKDSPFRCSWWYRTEFRIPDGKGQHIWLDFDGINNHAKIWLNGRQIAPKSDIAGAYRAYQFEITQSLARKGTNALAVEVFAQSEHDLGINWNDWNPTPPDKDMGLWRSVSLRASGALGIRSPQVITHFPGDVLSEADLTVEVQVRNVTSRPVAGIVAADLESLHLTQTVALSRGETRTVRFAPDRFPSLRIQNPELWWPRQMGVPALHELTIKASVGGVFSDSASIRYGIREITAELDTQGHRLFRINRKRILIRGAGWAPDMLLRENPDRLKSEFRYIRDLNLNAIRLEGPMVPDSFYDLADEQGVLVLAGWTCCDYWMDWKKWTLADVAIARSSLHSQILRMRSHPSLLVWMNGSDEAPPAGIEQAYVAELKALDWPNPYLASASEKPVAAGEPSGMKMLGPYDHTPPDYWFTDSKFGGAFGFASEISPGPAIPLESSLRKFLAPAEISPDSAAWNYHAGSERFTRLTHFNETMRASYGPPSSFDDYERKAQTMAYDAERAMFEAYSRNKYSSTGVIQWMLNNAWPSLIWHLYDYYLQPAGGYFGAKKACEPVHVQYSYDDRSVAVVNSTYSDTGPLEVTARVYDVDLHPKYLARSSRNVATDAVEKIFTLPEAFLSVSPVNFVQLTLEDASGKTIDENFYWVSTKKNTYDWSHTDAYTAISSYEDLTALQSLPSAGHLDVSATVEGPDQTPLVHVKLQNPSDYLAFQIHLGIHHKGEDAEILPVLWQDNYLELLPGVSREVTARILSPGVLNGDSELTVDGWNIDRSVLPLNQQTSRAAEPSGSR
jgi:exo-1,4-beta-D-glucosaminidase